MLKVLDKRLSLYPCFYPILIDSLFSTLVCSPCIPSHLMFHTLPVLTGITDSVQKISTDLQSSLIIFFSTTSFFFFRSSCQTSLQPSRTPPYNTCNNTHTHSVDLFLRLFTFALLCLASQTQPDIQVISHRFFPFVPSYPQQCGFSLIGSTIQPIVPYS